MVRFMKMRRSSSNLREHPPLAHRPNFTLRCGGPSGSKQRRQASQRSGCSRTGLGRSAASRARMLHGRHAAAMGSRSGGYRAPAAGSAGPTIILREMGGPAPLMGFTSDNFASQSTACQIVSRSSPVIRPVRRSASAMRRVAYHRARTRLIGTNAMSARMQGVERDEPSRFVIFDALIVMFLLGAVPGQCDDAETADAAAAGRDLFGLGVFQIGHRRCTPG